MTIVVLNGSPKGQYSITLQYVRYLEKQHPRQVFKVIHVAERIKQLERNEDLFWEVMAEIDRADAVIWCFGVWVLAVSAQLIRFIELVRERSAGKVFKEKATAALSTSIHYYDHIAHQYIRDVCDDLSMRYLDGISFDMLDLKSSKGRRQLSIFFQLLLDAVNRQGSHSAAGQSSVTEPFTYIPANPGRRIDPGPKKVLILSDKQDAQSNSSKMVNRLADVFEGNCTVVDLNDVDIRGACRGCMQCGYDYTCHYRDGFTDFYNKQVRTSDIIIMAGTIQGHFLSSTWKTFFDRAFFWNHTPSLEGKQIAFLVSGLLRENQNLVQFLEASVTARQNANLVDMMSDESADSRTIDMRLDELAQRMLFYASVGYVKPQNFLAVGGHKIFRDNIWGRLRGVWQADHRHYQRNGYYDFPQQKWMGRLANLMLMTATKIPWFRRKFYRNLVKFPSKRMGKLIENGKPAKEAGYDTAM